MNDYQTGKEVLWQQLRERLAVGMIATPENADLLRELRPPNLVAGLGSAVRYMAKGVPHSS